MFDRRILFSIGKTSSPTAHYPMRATIFFRLADYTAQLRRQQFTLAAVEDW